MGEARLSESAALAVLLPHFDSTATPSQSCNWYALKVRTGAELSTVTALRMRGFDPFCPTQKERRRYSDRMKAVETAVFPGYVFCKFDIQKKLPVVSAPGVEYIVGFAGSATPIPEVQIHHIRRMVKAGAGASLTDRFAQGQMVRVTHGPLEGVEGILVRDPRGDRLVVSIDLLHQSASLHIGQGQTKAI